MAAAAPRVCGVGVARYNVVVVSVAFLVVFSAYNALQNVATSLFPNGLGNESLSVLYGTCALSVFFAPPVLELLGTKYTMVLGAALYVVYMLSLIQIVPAVVLALSTVIGFGDIILWTAVGVFIAQNSSRAEYGRNSGLFWSIFQLCNIVGNLAVYYVLSQLQSTALLYVGFSVVAAVGTAMLLLLRQPVAASGAGADAGADADAHSGGLFKLRDGLLLQGAGELDGAPPLPSWWERSRSVPCTA